MLTFSFSLSNEGASAAICVTALLIILHGILSTVYPVRRVPTLLRTIIFTLMIFLGFAASGAQWINWFYGLLGFYVFSSLLEGIYHYWRFQQDILDEQNQEEQNQQQNQLQQSQQQNQVALNPMVLRLVVVEGNEARVDSSGDVTYEDPKSRSKRQPKERHLEAEAARDGPKQ